VGVEALTRHGLRYVEETGRLRAALNVPVERLLVELTITTGMRSGEVRGVEATKTAWNRPNK
jgi:hypothetical protein